MKRVYTICSVLLALVIFLTAMPVSAAPVATASIGTVTATRGETVTVPVSITDVTGIGAIALHISYDGNVLECVEAEAVGIMNQMDMNTANTSPVNHPNEVWLTGMGLEGMSGSGELMLITFKVKDSAPAGMSSIAFTAEGQELISGSPIEALEMALTDGGIMVKEGEAPPTTMPPLQSDVVTTAPLPTTNAPTTPTEAPSILTDAPVTPTDAPAPPTDATATIPTNAPANPTDAPVNPTDAPANPTDAPVNPTDAPVNPTDAPAAPAGTEPTTVPTSVVVTREDGTAVTDKQGQPVTKDSIGISVDKVTAKPGDTVTVNVSLSSVKALTAAGISVRYDTDALQYVSGECKGFFAEMSFADVSENEGIVAIGATNPQPVSGEGVVATLTFTVTKNAKNGAHRLTLDPAPMLMEDTADLPFTTFDGEVTVEGGAAAAGGTMTLYIVLGVVLVVVAALAIVLFIRKKKAAAPKAAKPTAPKQPKPVLPTDISDEIEDSFDAE